MTGTPSALLPRPDSPPHSHSPAPEPAPAARPSLPAEAAAVLLGTVLTAVQASRLGHWLVDDAAITFAYARSIDEGLGPVQQPGAEPVEGYSNPSWLALLVLGRRLGLFDSGRSLAGVADLTWYPKLLALLCTAGVLIAVATAARAAFPGRRLASPAVTLLAALAVGGNFSLVVWLFSGLENPLYALAVTALAAVLVRGAAHGTLTAPRTATAAGLLALLAALTRPDGAAYAAAHPVTVLLFAGAAARGARDAARDAGWASGREAGRSGAARSGPWADALRAAAVSAAAFLVPYAGFLAWRHTTFGRWVPNTAVAKAQGLPEPAQLSLTGELLMYAGWLLVLALAACAGLALGRPGPARRALAAALVPLGLALAVYGALTPDWMTMHRFATPVWTLGALAGALALVAVWLGAGARGRTALVAVAVVSVALSAAGRERPDARFEATPTVPMCFVAQRYGETFNTYADQLGIARGTLALPDLGGTLLTTRLTALDTAGLTDRTLADILATGDPGRVSAHVLGRVRPEFVHVHGAWARRTGLTPEVLTAHGYAPLSLRGVNGDWVRRDAVRDPARIEAVRAWAPANALRLDRLGQRRGRAACGPELTPGQALD
ncbi:hypothetical protein ACFYVL_12835 [Streptomyces sp. NPDC004111]|uniref:hypothetical protein n=1 Tax=Streptomyces sp. NPDC004111 TaxID=3364690 RepID=UPI0036CE8F96